MPITRHMIPTGMRLHPLRATDLTASDIAASQGLDPHKSALELYAQKTGMIEAQPDNPMMQRGRWMEPAVIAALLDLHPELRVRYPLDIYLRDDELRLGCTPDAIAQDEGEGIINVQCKVVTPEVFNREWKDGPPLAYQLQTLTEGMLLDARESIVAALVTGTYTAELHRFPVPRHPGAEAKVRTIAATFWDNVRTGRRPKADLSRDAEIIAAMFPKAQPEPVLDLTGDNRLPELLTLRAVLKENLKPIEARIKEIDTDIKEKMGPHEHAELPGWKLSWPTITVPEHMVKASTFRRLFVTPKEPKP